MAPPCGVARTCLARHESDQRKHLVTAAGKGWLRSYSLAKLRKYAKDYNINVDGVIEKDDLIDRIIAARVRLLDLATRALADKSP